MESKYKYKKVYVPVEIIEKMKEPMEQIGCRTFTVFVSMALTEFANKITSQNKAN